MDGHYISALSRLIPPVAVRVEGRGGKNWETRVKIGFELPTQLSAGAKNEREILYVPKASPSGKNACPWLNLTCARIYESDLVQNKYTKFKDRKQLRCHRS